MIATDVRKHVPEMAEMVVGPSSKYQRGVLHVHKMKHSGVRVGGRREERGHSVCKAGFCKHGGPVRVWQWY